MARISSKLMAYLARLFLVCTLIHTCLASPVPTNIGDWLHHELLPTNDGTIQDEIRCYALPYGGIGFLGHVLTYYTAVMLVYGQVPILPCLESRSSTLEFFLGILAIAGTVSISIMTMVACRQSWQFLLIALWKMLLSLSLGMMTLHRAVSDEEGEEDFDMFGWTVIYGIGTIIGIVGLFSLVHTYWDQNQNLRDFTYAFIAVSTLPFVIMVFIVAPCMACDDDHDDAGEMLEFGYKYGPIFFGLCCAFYSDWALACLDNNYSGTPSSDVAILYWIYFAAKRLPMFSF